VCPGSLAGSFTDPAAIRELASRVDVLTVEIEHVDADARAAAGAAAGVPVHPAPATVRLIQDKLLQKEETERFRNLMVVEGLIMLAEKKSPRFMQDRLNSFLEPKDHFNIDRQLGRMAPPPSTVS
jgi:phosphoribosylaminoimidazole carboxylase (NCAIR synthetase)